MRATINYAQEINSRPEIVFQRRNYSNTELAANERRM